MNLLAAFSHLGCLGAVPLVLALLVIVDIVRTGADWYWVPIVLFFPVLGPLAYVLLVRVPWRGGAPGGLSPAAARRRHAQRRLREIAIQLGNWRGPALLAEAGEESLVLGRIDAAERFLREAQQAGAAPDDVNFALAQVLEQRRRFAEAVPLLEVLRAADADQRFGAVQLHLARCLDEAGRTDEAERELRDLLSRRAPIEAQVRLARILARRGAPAGAAELLRTAAADAAQMPAYLRRENGPWIRAARRLARSAGTDAVALPPPRIEGAPRGGSALWILALGAVLLLLGALGIVLLFASSAGGFGRVGELQRRLLRSRERLAALDGPRRAAPADLGALAVSAEEMARFLAVRRAIAPSLALLEVGAVAEPPSAGGLPAALARQEAATARRLDVVDGLVAALAAQGLTPSRFEALLGVFDWRCLRRAGAEVFALPPHVHADWRLASARVRNLADLAPAPPGAEETESHRRLLRDRDDARQLLADFARLQAEDALDPSARELCAAHRDALGELPADGLPDLACILDDEAGCS